MLRIYLDKNIWTYFKDAKRTDAQALLNKLREIELHIVVPYSDALMADLANGYDETIEIKRTKTQEDLALIAELSESNYLTTDLRDSNPRAKVADPHIYFRNFISNEETKPYDAIEELQKMREEPGELGAAIGLFLDLLNTIPNPLNNGQLKGTPMAEMFSGNTQLEAMSSMMHFTNSMQESPEKYKDIRNYVKDNLQLGSHISQYDTNVVERLDNTMKKKPIQKSFTEFNNFIASNQKQSGEITRWDRILSAFSNLDVVGYKSDTLNNGYSNYINDIKHTFYASYCNFFITEDQKTSSKAKVVYEIENLNTQVFTIPEFLEHLNGLEFPVDGPISSSKPEL